MAGSVRRHRRIGFVWLIFWLVLYRKPEEHPSVSTEELALIRSDPAEKTGQVPWGRLVPVQRDVGFCARQVPHRSDLVVLPLLASSLSAGHL